MNPWGKESNESNQSGRTDFEDRKHVPVGRGGSEGLEAAAGCFLLLRELKYSQSRFASAHSLLLRLPMADDSVASL
jgi:hypothetical protein